MNKLRLTGLWLTRLLGLLLIYVSCMQVGYAQQSGGGNYPTGNGVRVREVDGSPNVPGTQTLVFPNGSLTRAGQTVTVTIAGGTTINSTNGQVPYRVNSTTFGDSAFASNALNSTYLSATSAASGSGLTLTVAGGGTNENLILSPKGTGTVRLVNAAGTDFSRLQLGGTSASFPAIKRNGASIDFRLADDSAYAAIVASSITATGGNAVLGNTVVNNNIALWGNASNVLTLIDAGFAGANARLNIGGTSSSFPSLKRSSTALHVRLADDSDFAPIAASVVGHKSYTVATLPTASSFEGATAYVTDANATTRLSTVAGGGSNKVIVFSDGTNWLIL